MLRTLNCPKRAWFKGMGLRRISFMIEVVDYMSLLMEGFEGSYFQSPMTCLGLVTQELSGRWLYRPGTLIDQRWSRMLRHMYRLVLCASETRLTGRRKQGCCSLFLSEIGLFNPFLWISLLGYPMLMTCS